MDYNQRLTSKRIIFYDGDCGFCNSTVQFVLRHRKNDFYFVPLQSEIATVLLGKKGIEVKMNTLYYHENDTFFEKSDAVLKISKHLQFPYSIIRNGKVVPRFLRDYLYSQVAKRRHKIKKGFCVVLKEGEKQFFL